MMGNAFEDREEQIEENFLAIIHAGGKIDNPRLVPMPALNLLKKTVITNWLCEQWGGINYFRCLHLAPNEAERRFMEVIAREELGHARILEEGTLRSLGVNPYEHFCRTTVADQGHILSVFQHPEMLTRSWGDVLVFNRLQDASADMQLDEIAECFYTILCHDIHKIEMEEKGHVEHGERSLREYVGTPSGFDEVSEALNFWLPEVLKVFGKPDGKSKSMPLYIKYGIKKRTSDQSRALFLKSITRFFASIGFMIFEDGTFAVPHVG
ncbi:MAG: Phenylacetic acid catabolic protein [bacterium]|nr:Phenylacetic acid catabolic protein [bacterium]